MDFNIQGYATVFLERHFKAASGRDFTLDETGAIIAWNTLKGAQPTPQEVSAGVLKLIKQDITSRFNNLSGDIRNSYLSDGAFIVEEYRLAELEALDFKARGYLAPVPTTISDYAQILGAADTTMVANAILTASVQMRTILTMVRKVRLTATTAITYAAVVDQVVTAYNAVVTSLEGLRKPAA